jgi:quercetin dioxygenase-like cupin family protein
MRLTRRLLFVGLSLATCLPVYGQEVPHGVTMFNAAKGPWQKDPAGGELALIYGDPAKPGPYLYVRKSGARRGPAAEPHTHPDNRTYTVISGTWYVGFGTQFDEAKLIALPAGSVYTEPAGVPHFVVIKDDGVIVQVGGTGPTRIVPVDATKK